jgi:RNA-directed DNA polymerase
VSEPKPKPFEISKWAVWEAYRRVKANKGAGGVDEQSLREFERDLAGNLHKLWNRLSSGSYLPPPVRAVEIPKRDGSSRVLGVPTVADRIAQTVAAAYLEPEVEPRFHPNSYGYRPGRSALDAVGVCRERCWREDRVVDLDLKSFFDSVPHDLVLRAVARHTDQRWILLYVERWLKAPLEREDGSLVGRDRGTPQGSAISPLLANAFLHYAFDAWMAREHPAVRFERYCDDVIVHARSERQAHQLRAAIASRLAECGLELNERKTRIVYCKDANRRGSYERESFDFLGYTFRPRLSKSRHGKHFVNFSPAASGGPGTPSVAGLKSADLVDSMGRLHRHRCHILDLVSPTPGRVLFGPAVTISYFPSCSAGLDPERYNLRNLFYEAVGTSRRARCSFWRATATRTSRWREARSSPDCRSTVAPAFSRTAACATSTS